MTSPSWGVDEEFSDEVSLEMEKHSAKSRALHPTCSISPSPDEVVKEALERAVALFRDHCRFLDYQSSAQALVGRLQAMGLQVGITHELNHHTLTITYREPYEEPLGIPGSQPLLVPGDQQVERPDRDSPPHQ